MDAIFATGVAVETLLLFVIFLSLALAGCTFGEALAWFWEAAVHPAEKYRKIMRGEW